MSRRVFSKSAGGWPRVLGAVAGVALGMMSAAVAVPAWAATYTVTNLNDSGAGSLRAAITSANGNPGADVIEFAAGGQGVILLASTLPVITDSLTVNGVFGAVRIDGGNAVRAFVISGPINVTLSNLIIQNVRAVGTNGGTGMPFGGGGGGGLGAGAGVMVASGSPTVQIVSTAFNTAVVIGGNGGDVPSSGGNTGGNGGNAGFPGSAGGIGGTVMGPASTAGVLGGGGAGGGSSFSPGAQGEGGGGGGAGTTTQTPGTSTFLGGTGGTSTFSRAGGGGGGGAAGAAVFAFTGTVTFTNSGYSGLSATAGMGGMASSQAPNGTVGTIPSYAAPGATISGSFVAGPATPTAPPAPVPTLGEWSMILLSLMLVGVGVWTVRRTV